ncbi:MAG: hypothetical protein HQL35_13015 [Alphaproteobacteria bacterium]|nr:hypothetical protein [Alphaproteobacteria bacterium]
MNEERRTEPDPQTHVAQAVGAFAAHVAHSLNNVLFPIVAMTEMVLEDLPQDSPHRGRLDKAVNAAHRMQDFITRIHAVSCKTNFHMERIVLADLARECVDVFRNNVPPGLVLKMGVEAEVTEISGSPGRIRSLLNALIENAVEAMDDRAGTIDVSVSHTSRVAGWTGEEEFVTVTVRDDGKGMDAETLEHLYQPFFTTKQENDQLGTGLGLTMAYAIMVSHGGRVQIESHPGAGTKVQLFFPCRPKSEKKR